jgi:hypothetical protein
MIGKAAFFASGPAAAQSPRSTMSREVLSATGCLRLAAADGASAETGEGIGPGFVLKGVRVAPNVGLVEAPTLPATPSSHEGTQATTSAEPGSGAPPADGQAVAPGAPAPARDNGFLLVADRGINLSEHLGHRILVTGRLASFAAAGGVASTASGRTLTVTTVSMIAPACTTGS